MNKKSILELVLHGPVNKSRSISKHLLGLVPYFVHGGISMKRHGPCSCLFPYLLMYGSNLGKSEVEPRLSCHRGCHRSYTKAGDGPMSCSRAHNNNEP